MTTQYHVIINTFSGEQYRDGGLHAVTFDTKRDAEDKLDDIVCHHRVNGWTTMSNDEAIEFFEARIEAYTMRQLQEAAFA